MSQVMLETYLDQNLFQPYGKLQSCSAFLFAESANLNGGGTVQLGSMCVPESFMNIQAACLFCVVLSAVPSCL